MCYSKERYVCVVGTEGNPVHATRHAPFRGRTVGRGCDISDRGARDVGTEDIGTGDVGTGDVGTGDVGTEDVGTGDVGSFGFVPRVGERGKGSGGNPPGIYRK